MFNTLVVIHSCIIVVGIRERRFLRERNYTQMVNILHLYISLSNSMSFGAIVRYEYKIYLGNLSELPCHFVINSDEISEVSWSSESRPSFRYYTP